MKDKLITISLFIVGSFLIAAMFYSVFTNVFAKAQDEIISGLKQVEKY